jgi:hypothetical protein
MPADVGERALSDSLDGLDVLGRAEAESRMRLAGM